MPRVELARVTGELTSRNIELKAATPTEIAEMNRVFIGKPTSPFQVALNNRWDVLRRKHLPSFQTEIARQVKEKTEHPDGFDTVVVPYGGPDILGVLDFVADGGRIVSVGRENVVQFKEAEVPTRGRWQEGDAWGESFRNDAATLTDEVLLFPTLNLTGISYRSTLYLASSLAFAGLNKEDVQIEQQATLERDGQSPIIITELGLNYKGKHVTVQLVNGITFPDSQVLAPDTVEYQVIQGLIDSPASSDILAVSKGAHVRGISTITPFLPDRAYAVLDDLDEEQEYLGKFGVCNLVDMSNLSGDWPNAKAQWGYAHTLGEVSVGIIEKIKPVEDTAPQAARRDRFPLLRVQDLIRRIFS